MNYTKRLTVSATTMMAAMSVYAQSINFDFPTSSLAVPSVQVGTETFKVVLRYDSDGRLTIVSATPADNVPVAPVGWTDTAILSAEGAGPPRIGIDSAGNATAIWLQSDPGSSRRSVWASRKPAGANWTVPTQLESSDTDFFDLDLAVDAASGKSVAVWRGATKAEIYARTADVSGVWGTTTSLHGVGSNINDLQVRIDASGNAMAVWSQTPVGSTVTSIWSNRYHASNGWGGAVRVSVAANDRQDLDPSLAMGGNGLAVVVWTRNGTGVVASNTDIAGQWNAISVLAAGTVSTGVGAPIVVSDKQGNATAVWAQAARDGNNQLVTNLASKRFVGGAWSANPQSLYTPITTNVLSQVRLAVNGVGQVAAIWTEPDTRIRTVQTDAADQWMSPAVVRPSGLEIFGQPEIGIDALGNMLATWTARSNQSAGTPQVLLNQFSPTSGWGQAVVHQTTADPTGNSRLLVNDRGHAAMGWLRNGSDGSRVVSRYFTSGR